MCACNYLQNTEYVFIKFDAGEFCKFVYAFKFWLKSDGSNGQCINLCTFSCACPESD
jgi:hypothetical protein